MAGRCLIVANQTLGGEALDRSVKECLDRDVGLFYLVVPITAAEHETSAWSGGFSLGGALPPTARAALEEEAARRREAGPSVGSI